LSENDLEDYRDGQDEKREVGKLRESSALRAYFLKPAAMILRREGIKILAIILILLIVFRQGDACGETAGGSRSAPPR